VRTIAFNKVKIQLGKHFNSYRRGSHGAVLHASRHGVYYLLLHSPC